LDASVWERARRALESAASIEDGGEYLRVCNRSK
jgi:hypothetical protein